MKYVPYYALSLTALLAACGQGNQPANGSETAAGPNEAMANMAMPTSGKAAKGIGIITALDAAAGKITLNHEAISEIGWPAMTMAFDAQPAVLQGLAVGDKVEFDVLPKNGSGEIIAVRK